MKKQLITRQKYIDNAMNWYSQSFNIEMRLKSNNLLLTFDKQFPLEMPTTTTTKSGGKLEIAFDVFLYLYTIFFTVQYNNDSHNIDCIKKRKK